MSLETGILDLIAVIRVKLNAMMAAYRPMTLAVAFDGGGAAIATNTAIDVPVPVGCVVQSWAIYASPSGSIEFDIQKVSHANWPPNSGNSICATARPALSGAAKAQSGVLTGWTTAIGADEVLRFTVPSAASITRATIALKLARG